jgi:hypothetical protein
MFLFEKKSFILFHYMLYDSFRGEFRRRRRRVKREAFGMFALLILNQY